MRRAYFQGKKPITQICQQLAHLVQAGVDLSTVQRTSGHKTLSMAAPYAHQSRSHIEAVLDRLEGRVSGRQEYDIRKNKPISSARLYKNYTRTELSQIAKGLRY